MRPILAVSASVAGRMESGIALGSQSACKRLLPRINSGEIKENDECPKMLSMSPLLRAEVEVDVRRRAWREGRGGPRLEVEGGKCWTAEDLTGPRMESRGIPSPRRNPCSRNERAMMSHSGIIMGTIGTQHTLHPTSPAQSCSNCLPPRRAGTPDAQAKMPPRPGEQLQRLPACGMVFSAKT